MLCVAGPASANYMVQTKLHDPALLMQNCFLYIAKCPFNKIKILPPVMIGIKEKIEYDRI